MYNNIGIIVDCACCFSRIFIGSYDIPNEILNDFDMCACAGVLSLIFWRVPKSRSESGEL